MDQDWEEKKIRELFQELKQEDERLTPPFASAFRKNREAALSRTGRTHQPWRVLQVAAVAILLILLGGSVFVFFRQSSRQPTPAERLAGTGPAHTESAAPVTRSQMPALPEPSKAELSKTVRQQRSRARHRRSAIVADASLISQWRPPTDFLLKFPGEQLLKTVPRLGESSVEIEVIRPDEQN